MTSPTPAVDDRAVIGRVDNWRRPDGSCFLSAYYYAFEATGCDPIDRVLSAVAVAGKTAHHTEAWGEHGCDAEIQREAERAAQEVERLRGPLKEALGLAPRLARHDRSHDWQRLAAIYKEGGLL